MLVTVETVLSEVLHDHVLCWTQSRPTRLQHRRCRSHGESHHVGNARLLHTAKTRSRGYVLTLWLFESGFVSIQFNGDPRPSLICKT